MSQRFRILVADKIALDGLAPLRDDEHFELVVRPGLPEAELAAALADCDAVVVRSAAKVTRAALAQAERLKVIGRAGVGVDTIDVEAATERGIAVLNAPAGNTISAAELTMALMLALARKISQADRSMHAGGWERGAFSGVELHGKTLGLIGAGRIGSEVARRARAFGMRVTLFDPYLSEERARALGGEPLPLNDLLRTADVLSLHVPLTAGTAGLIGEAELALLKPTAMLINAARGGVVQEEALCRALTEGKFAGAALDVFDTEPLPADHPLRRLDHVILTPHLGASTEEAQQSVALEIAEAVRAALLEGDLSRAVNAPAIGGQRMRRLRPLLDLATRLGRLATALAPGPVTTVDVRYAGQEDDALPPLTAAALQGVLSDVVGRTGVNFVNAMHLATARGLGVGRRRLSSQGPYGEYVEIVLTGSAGEMLVAGALLSEMHPRVVRIGEHFVDIVPRGAIVVLRNKDVPGVIGRVGTILGRAGINIGEYHQARIEAGGEALAAVSVDERLDPAVIAELRAAPEVLEVRQAFLD